MVIVLNLLGIILPFLHPFSLSFVSLLALLTLLFSSGLSSFHHRMTWMGAYYECEGRFVSPDISQTTSPGKNNVYC